MKPRPTPRRSNALPGFRYALHWRVRGNTGLYRRLLRTHANSCVTPGMHPRRRGVQGDGEALYREAHDLKGVCGNLGVEVVAEAGERSVPQNPARRTTWPA